MNIVNLNQGRRCPKHKICEGTFVYCLKRTGQVKFTDLQINDIIVVFRVYNGNKLITANQAEFFSLGNGWTVIRKRGDSMIRLMVMSGFEGNGSDKYQQMKENQNEYICFSAHWFNLL